MTKKHKNIYTCTSSLNLIYNESMRLLILIALLFAFSAGSYVDMAHAHAGNHLAEHHLEHDDGEPCHSEQDQNQDENGCDGCCCIHSHAMATSVTPTKNLFSTKQKNIIASLDSYYSTELSGLKRPPRL